MSLINGTSARDEETFKSIYSLYAPSLLGIISRIIKNDELAETVLEETFSTIYKDLPHFNKDHYRLFTWIAMIAKATALNKITEQPFQQDRKISNSGIFELIYKDGLKSFDVAKTLNLSVDAVCKELRLQILRIR